MSRRRRYRLARQWQAEGVTGPVVIEVRPARDPADRPAVLLQLPHGWVTLLPPDARAVAAMLLSSADEVTDAHNF